MTTNLAAVVMAGGLGTRMRSAVPKHFHPLLGRPMVDWMIAAGRERRRRPARRRRLAGDARRFASSGVTVAVQESRSAPATPCARRRPRSTGSTATCSSSPATRRCYGRAARANSSRRTAARAPTRRSSAPSRPTRGSTAASSATPTAPCSQDRRGHRRERRGAARSARSTRRSTSSAPSALWPALERLEPKNVQGELYLTDAIEHPRRAAAARSSPTSPPTSARPTASTRASSWRTPPPSSATASTSGTCSPA